MTPIEFIYWLKKYITFMGVNSNFLYIENKLNNVIEQIKPSRQHAISVSIQDADSLTFLCKSCFKHRPVNELVSNTNCSSPDKLICEYCYNLQKHDNQSIKSDFFNSPLNSPFGTYEQILKDLDYIIKF